MQQPLKRRNVYNHLNTDQFFYDSHSYHIRMLIIIDYSLLDYTTFFQFDTLQILPTSARSCLQQYQHCPSTSPCPRAFWRRPPCHRFWCHPLPRWRALDLGSHLREPTKWRAAEGAASCRVGTAWSPVLTIRQVCIGLVAACATDTCKGKRSKTAVC